MTPEAVVFLAAPDVFATDWRFETAARVSTWLEAEYDWWQINLGWDLRSAWTAVEPARASGQLPGLLIEDADGQSVGWSFFLRHGDSLQVASIIAAEREATAALVDGILASPEAADASTVVSFTRAQAPGLAEELEERGFDVEAYRHLEVPTAGFTLEDTSVDPWYETGSARVQALLERAYQSSRTLRPFAPNGQPHEWAEYVSSLVDRNACGRFLPEASGVIARANDGEDSSSADAARANEAALDGAVVVTTVGLKTAHVAQIAVDPSARGNGLGAQLICAAAAAANAQGYERLTLLVAETNAAAGALYERLGFRQTATFLAAVRRSR
jgi:ribosomal protein S18 acetylase RimI-like enzyme